MQEDNYTDNHYLFEAPFKKGRVTAERMEDPGTDDPPYSVFIMLDPLLHKYSIEAACAKAKLFLEDMKIRLDRAGYETALYAEIDEFPPYSVMLAIDREDKQYDDKKLKADLEKSYAYALSCADGHSASNRAIKTQQCMQTITDILLGYQGKTLDNATTPGLIEALAEALSQKKPKARGE